MLKALRQRWPAIGRDAAGSPRWLAAIGVLSAVAYAVWWTWPTWLFSVSLHQHALALPDLLGNSVRGALSYTQAVAIPFLLYLLALGAAGRARSRLAVLVGVAGAVGLPLALVFAYPSLAADVFGYLMSARIWIEHGANPYVTAAASFLADPYFPPVGWPQQPTVYGPALFLITAVPIWLAGSDPIRALIALKLLTIIAHAGTAWLIYLIVRRLAPQRAVFALVAYGWNPLTVVYFGVDAHIDLAPDVGCDPGRLAARPNGALEPGAVRVQRIRCLRLETRLVALA